MSDTNQRIAYEEQDVQSLIDFFATHATYKEVFKVVDIIKKGQRITLNPPVAPPVAQEAAPEAPTVVEPIPVPEPPKTRKTRKAKAQETV